MLVIFFEKYTVKQQKLFSNNLKFTVQQVSTKNIGKNWNNYSWVSLHSFSTITELLDFDLSNLNLSNHSNGQPILS